jgi:regulator of RNase E activity RraA
MWALQELDFPVFGIGNTPADSLGRIDVISIGEPIQIDGVKTKNGDWVLGDQDGVVIIPSESAVEALRLAQEKVSGENTVREELRAGVPVAEVFRRHGIL